ncbi:MAG: hypothetical protein RRB13_01095 [bacterium]|nr:hypothetical protein [bacterium]
MHISVDKFSDAQRRWYVELIVQAIRVDGVVDIDEMDFIFRMLHFLDQKERLWVNQMLRSKTPVDATQVPPDGFSLAALASIFSELILLMVADAKLTSKERNFLLVTAEKCSIPASTTKELMDWGERVYDLERERRQILARAQ